ncbi:MAG TPA: acyl-CoA dehydrogenase [Rhodospirillales bacterium]|nr:acyl-CoA dehydrogenase [Rhodospirillales bacterium]
MDFALPEELEAVRESVRRFVEREWLPVADRYEESGTFPRAEIRRMGEAGFFGAAFPEELGGSALGFLAVSVIAEELSRRAPELGYCMNMQAMTCPFTIFNWGEDRQVRAFVPDLIAGRRIGMFPLTEPGGGSDPRSSIRTTARREGGIYRLDGAKMFITFAHAADAGILFARVPGAPGHGITAFIVEPKRHPGFRAHGIRMSGLSWALRANALFLEDFRVPVEHRLGAEGEGLRIALNALEYGRLTVSARLAGLARACCDLAVAYAREREVGGRAIGRYQMVQERIADAVVMADAARLMAYRVGWAMDRGLPANRIAARAKYFATMAAKKAAAALFEVHGGYALADDCPVRKLRAYVDMLTVGEGTENVQRILIAEDALGYRDADRHPSRNRLRRRTD